MTAQTINPCWKQIGALGDGTCPNLEEFVNCTDCPAYSHQGRSLLDREIPEDYANEMTELLAQEKKVEEAEAVSAVVFRLGKEWLALLTRYFEKIDSVRVFHRIPHRSNAVLLGLANFRGELLLCISLAGVLKLEEAEAQESQPAQRSAGRMVVVRDESERWVFPVDEVDGIHRLPVSQMGPVPATVARAPLTYTKGIFKLGDKRVAFLDEQLVFSTLKRSMRWQATK